MAGYSGYSMSNNAVQAYNEGKLPLSKIKRDKLNEYNITISVEMFKWICQYKSIIRPCEWHHTSKYYNETYFYDLKQASKILAKADLTSLEKEYKNWKSTHKPKKKDNSICFALVSYEILVGLDKKRKYKTFSDYAVICNGWAYLTSGTKKSIEGKRFWIVEQYDEKPEQISDELLTVIQNKL